eukprot:4199136-Prymnesium_polylepis.1
MFWRPENACCCPDGAASTTTVSTDRRVTMTGPKRRTTPTPDPSIPLSLALFRARSDELLGLGRLLGGLPLRELAHLRRHARGGREQGEGCR